MLNNKIKFVLGFLIILSYLGIRFREKIPHNLLFCFSFEYFGITLFFIGLYSYLIYKLFTPSEKNNVTKKISNFFFDSLKEFYEQIYFYIEKQLTKYIPKIFKYFPYSTKFWKIIYFIFTILPRICLVITFFIDVVYFNKMFYFYNFAIIIWIPILFQLIWYIFKNWSNKMFCLFKKHFIILIDGQYFENKIDLSQIRKTPINTNVKFLYTMEQDYLY